MPEQTGATLAISDATTEPNSQAAPAVTGEPAPATPPPATPPDAPPATDDAEGLGDKGKQAIDRMKSERDDAAKRAKKAEDELKKLTEASLSEQDKKDKRLAELEADQKAWEQERREFRIEQAIGRLVTTLSLVDVETVLRLVDPAKVQFDDDGIPTNVEAVVKDLVKAKPFLVGQPSKPTPGGINAGDGISSGPPPNLTAEELEAAKKSGMTPERYAAMKSVTTLPEWQKVQPAKAAG